MVYFYSYLQRENDKLLKSDMNNFSHFKISTFSFKQCPPISAAP